MNAKLVDAMLEDGAPALLDYLQDHGGHRRYVQEYNLGRLLRFAANLEPHSLVDVWIAPNVNVECRRHKTAYSITVLVVPCHAATEAMHLAGGDFRKVRGYLDWVNVKKAQYENAASLAPMNRDWLDAIDEVLNALADPLMPFNAEKV